MAGVFQSSDRFIPDPGSHVFLADLLNLLQIKAFKMILPFFFVEILDYSV